VGLHLAAGEAPIFLEEAEERPNPVVEEERIL
jgi:hypothetical protein